MSSKPVVRYAVGQEPKTECNTEAWPGQHSTQIQTAKAGPGEAAHGALSFQGLAWLIRLGEIYNGFGQHLARPSRNIQLWVNSQCNLLQDDSRSLHAQDFEIAAAEYDALTGLGLGLFIRVAEQSA